MTADPWLSIVTVVKDDPEGLERTLASLAGQDLSGVEYLIVDSSTDRSAVPAALARSGVVGSAEWTVPAGIYPAMNTGLASARGTYVYFLNAGDELLSEGLARMRAAALSDPAWLHADVEIVQPDGAVVVTPPLDLAAERAHVFARGRFPAHQGTIVRTALLRSVGGFDTSYRITADYAAFLRLSTVADGAGVDGPLARFHEGGASTTGWARSLAEFHRARRQILQPVGAAARRERMATLRQFAHMAAHRSPWPLVAALALISWAVMVGTGVPWLSGALLVVAVVLQGVGGAIAWRLVRPQRAVPVLEAVGMGLGLGTAVSMLVGLVLPWWLASLLALVLWAFVGRSARIRVRPAALAPLQRPDLAALVVGLVPGFGALVLALRSYPLTWTGLWTNYHGDMAFFEALAASVARLGPGSSIFMAGAELRYHSLAYGWAGQLTMTVDAAPFVVLTRVLPLAMTTALVALAAACARQLTRAWWAPSLAAVLVVTGGFVGATYGGVVNFDSPSQTVSTVWLLAASLVFLQGLDRHVSLGWHAVLLAALVVAMTGGKVSTAVVAGCGIGAVVVIGLLRREAWGSRALVLGLAGAAALVGTYWWLLSGSANAGGLALFSLLDRASSVQGLNPVITPRGVLAGIVLLIIAVLPRWAGLAWLLGNPGSRWQPSTLFGLGLAVAGVGSLAVLSGGFNDLWFAIAVSAPLAVLSAVGVASAVAWLGPAARRRVVLAGVLGLIASVVVAWVWATGSTGVIGDGWRWAGPLVAFALAVVAALLLARGRMRPAFAYLVVVLVMMAVPARLVYAVAEPFARDYEGSRSPVLYTEMSDFVPILDAGRSAGWTDAEASAGSWLRGTASGDDLVATNMTSSALVPALTRLTTYLSDLPLQAPYGREPDIATAQEREAASWAFINAPSRRTVAALCEAGVDWVWVDERRTEQRTWRPFADVVWRGPDVTILRILPSACG